MTVDYDYLSKEEKERLLQLKEKVNDAREEKDWRKYTTEITIMYEKARVRREKRKNHKQRKIDEIIGQKMT
ncbi:hypothetical protein ACFPTR_02535 [Aliibacillus thermotolerans]|uniref:Uncharacterized protein n=1 Tax=Aliibacillus thermotolerans TaxID=1834418 RepID=A0ABW0U4X2_9BACI|nr:hypothetical protein [Aliibacillus thermotolerans]MDA3129264.1 hypothetical protein [Aliibacillus thermotolerans]